jgi:selenocysteine lyase/cysteine desulfurase
VLSANIKGILPEAVGAILDGDFNIAVRTGLHCAPLVHENLGTITAGTVRFSPGNFNTESDIDRAIEAMSKIAGYRQQ